MHVSKDSMGWTKKFWVGKVLSTLVRLDSPTRSALQHNLRKVDGWITWSCFFCETLISKTTLWMKLFFFSHKNMSWDEAEKSAYCSSLSLISLFYLCIK